MLQKVCLHHVSPVKTHTDLVSYRPSAVAILQVLQAMGIVHRDVSSGNIMFHKGVGKLMDFEFCMEYDRKDHKVHQELSVCPISSLLAIVLTELEGNTTVYVRRSDCG